MNEAEDRNNRKLRILVIAYEFPPSPSPQSLRWAYLSSALARRGHEIHVLAPRQPGADLAGLVDDRVHVHYIDPGPVRAALALLARNRRAASRPMAGEQPAAGSSRPNMRGVALGVLQSALTLLRFPDMRAEWRRPAIASLPALLAEVGPDVVIASHEPATCLQIGLAAKARGHRLVADLGDPVLTSYTPWWWRRRARRLERRTLRESDHVVVTSTATAGLLRARHGNAVPVSVVPQGFDAGVSRIAGRSAAPFVGPLQLLYSGRFYRFRDPRPLVEAVLEVPGVRLDIASGNVPGWLVKEAACHPDRVRLLGHLAHERLLQLQQEADILVNIANLDPVQVPGKAYEYFGACRPILHVAPDPGDQFGRLLVELGRGWSVAAKAPVLAKRLSELALAHGRGELDRDLDLSPGRVAAWSWSAGASEVERVLLSTVRPTPDGGGDAVPAGPSRIPDSVRKGETR